MSSIPLSGGVLSCITESLCGAGGEIIVVAVEGEVDLYTLPILRARWMTVSSGALFILLLICAG